jgi:exosome complex exonuclease RRP6
MESVIAAFAARGIEITDPSASIGPLLAAARGYPSSEETASSFESTAISHAGFAARVAAQQRRVATLVRALAAAVEPSPGVAEAVAAPFLVAADARTDADMVAFFEFVDRLREVTETALDEWHGLGGIGGGAGDGAGIGAGAAGGRGADLRRGGGGGGGDGRLVAHAGIAKPQACFPDFIDNSRDTAFVPVIASRYLPFADGEFSGSSKVDGGGDVGGGATASGDAHFRFIPPPAATLHPLLNATLSLRFAPDQLVPPQAPAVFVGVDDVEFSFINSPVALDSMMAYLEGTGDGADADAAHRVRADGTGRAPIREIAIDLEHHSVRSFQGFTCLIQISTRERDFIVDPLSLRGSVHVLNRITADARVVKVLHGCDSDVLWLQRDFGVFLINVFDTGQAARVLAYPAFSLAHMLLKHVRQPCTRTVLRPVDSC